MIWSKQKKRVEALFAPCLVGRVELRSTSYRGAHDESGRGYISVDGEEVWSMASIDYWPVEGAMLREVAARQGCSPRDAQPVALAELAREGEYGQYAFYTSLERFCSGTVDDNLAAEDVLVRALTMCDRRLGKRRLRSMTMKDEHPMVRRFYEVRMDAEGLSSER